MGGIGSGRHWYYGTKETTTNYWELDVRRWQRDGWLTPGRAFSCQWLHDGRVAASIQVHVEASQVILTYRHRSGEEAWKDESYPVPLSWTACHFGGERPWFHCPATGCGRRVAILYGGGIFACRHCYQLTYPSQREADYDRAMRRAEKIREKLGWKRGILNFLDGKPKGMHWNTFDRLADEYSALIELSLDGMDRHFRLSLK